MKERLYNDLRNDELTDCAGITEVRSTELLKSQVSRVFEKNSQ